MKPKYREKVAQYCRKLVSIEQTNANYRPVIEDVFVQLRAERSPDGRNGRGGVLEGDHLDDDRNGPELLDFRGKNPVEIENMLRSAGNLVILGEPGSGKSTLLRYLAANCADSHSESPVVPLFLPLREVAAEVAAWEGDDSLFTERAASFSRYKLDIHIPKEFFNRSLQEGRCLFFLDALDEVPASDRGALVGKIGDLVEEYSNNRFVVTSRRAGYDDRPLPQTEGFFNRYLVQPMEDDDITSFVNSRFDDDPEEAAQAMSILDGNPGIKALAANPLLLAIFNMLQGRSSGLPLNRAEFYKQAVDTLIEDKDDAGKPIDDARLEGHGNLLTHIARLFHDENRETIGRAELEDRAADLPAGIPVRNPTIPPVRTRTKLSPKPKLSSNAPRRRTGLLVEEHPGSGIFKFVHATFREYLTAKDIHNRRRNYSRHREACWDEIKHHLADARWREVTLFLLGSLDDRYCTYLTEKILAAGDEALSQPRSTELPTHLQLAAEALANRAPMSPGLQKEIVGRLERVVKGKTSVVGIFVKPRAVRTLGAVKHLPELVNPALAAIATDPAVDAGTRASAANGLGRLGEPETAIAILSAIATDPAVDAVPRVSAAEGLARLGEPDTATAILSAIATDPAVYAGIRASAANGLGRLGEPETAIAILSAIATGPAVYAGTRASAAQGIRRLGEPETAIAILSAIATDPAVDVEGRRYIVNRLSRLGEDGIAELTTIAKGPEIAGVDRSLIVDVLAIVVRRPEEGGNSEAAKAALAQLAQDDTVSADVRSRAAWQLGWLGEVQAAIASLTDLVKDPATPAMEKVRDAGAIQEFGGSTEEPIAAMRAGIADSEIGIGVRIPMAWRLSGLGERDEGIATLAAIANDETVDDINRVDAAWYLGRLDASDSARPALNALTEVAGRETADPWRRFQAGKVLVDLGFEETAIAALTAVAHNSVADVEVRIEATEVLAKLGDKAMAELILQTIADDRSLSNAARRDARGALRKLNKE